MSNVGDVLALAVLTLVSTTIDDIVVLLSFCSEIEASTTTTRAEKRSSYFKLTCGYMAGFTLVVVISFIGLALSYLVQPKYIAFLGFIPILIGVKMLKDAYHENAHVEFYNYVRFGRKPEDEEEVSDNKVKAEGKSGNGESENPQVVNSTAEKYQVENSAVTELAALESGDFLRDVTPQSTGANEHHEHHEHAHHHHSHVPRHKVITSTKVHPTEGDRPLSANEANHADDKLDVPVEAIVKQRSFIEETAGVTAKIDADGDVVVGDEEMGYMAQKLQDLLLACGINKQVVIVAATTFSVGSDNIAVYISLFSQSDGGTIAITLAMFYFMTFMYAILCIWLVGSVKGLGEILDILAKPIVPFVLMGIGLYILSESILFKPHE